MFSDISPERGFPRRPNGLLGMTRFELGLHIETDKAFPLSVFLPFCSNKQLVDGIERGLIAVEDPVGKGVDDILFHAFPPRFFVGKE